MTGVHAQGQHEGPPETYDDWYARLADITVGDLFTTDDLMCSRIIQHAHDSDQALVDLVTDHAADYGNTSAIAGINAAASILREPPAILDIIRIELATE